MKNGNWIQWSVRTVNLQVVHVALHRKGPDTGPELRTDMDVNGQFHLNEFTETIVKLYHDKAGGVDETGKQSDADAMGDEFNVLTFAVITLF